MPVSNTSEIKSCFQRFLAEGSQEMYRCFLLQILLVSIAYIEFEISLEHMEKET